MGVEGGDLGGLFPGWRGSRTSPHRRADCPPRRPTPVSDSRHVKDPTVGRKEDHEEPSEVEGPAFAGVVFNRPLDTVFTYRVPTRLRGRLQPGHRVKAPLGRGNAAAIGYVVSTAQETHLDARRLKEIIELVDDVPLIDTTMLDLTRWMAGYYLCSWGQALDAVVPAGVKKQAGTRLRSLLTLTETGRALAERLQVREALANDQPPPTHRPRRRGSGPSTSIIDTSSSHQTTSEDPLLKVTPKQAAALLTLAGSNEPLSLVDLCRLAECGASAIAALKKSGYLAVVMRRGDTLGPSSEGDKVVVPPPSPDPPANPVSRPLLTPEQTATLEAMAPRLESGGFATFLLHGVTGSGKTEVYLSAIERVVARGREAIVLVPEISLTPQTIRRFRRRFDRVAVLHSHLGDAERHRHWRDIASGAIQVVVGARSAIFAPTRKLGLIVIDEEHETTFKQETVPRYHARDVAVKRGQLEGVPVILGSATPSLESWRNAQLGRYTYLEMSNRVESRPLPPVTIIDMRHEKPEPGRAPGGLSAPLRDAMRRALNDDGQVILLLNRRGFHTYIHCPRCGFVLKCDSCDVALTHHKTRGKVVCHTCDAERDPPPICPECQGGRLSYMGIGTERLEREVKAEFGDRVVRRMDSDTMRSSASYEQVLNSFKEGKIDILLGTQMIAKGLDFPNVTLVGVINADTALHLPDFRARERTFQLVAQVAGRTGRGQREGRVLVQTYSPDDPAIVHAAMHDYVHFVEQELPERSIRGYPPYGRIVRLVARGPEEQVVRGFLEQVLEAIRRRAVPGVASMGPAPAPVAKIRDLYRYHAQLRAETAKPLHEALRWVVGEIPPPSGVELAIDVDPVSML